MPTLVFLIDVDNTLIDNDFVKSDLDEHIKVEMRSEEHTSELQSQSNLVCRLLLETQSCLFLVCAESTRDGCSPMDHNVPADSVSNRGDAYLYAYRARSLTPWSLRHRDLLDRCRTR